MLLMVVDEFVWLFGPSDKVVLLCCSFSFCVSYEYN